MRTAAVCSVILLLLFGSSINSYSQVTYTQNMPKYNLSFVLGYNYALGNANGDPSGINLVYDNTVNHGYFVTRNFGMQQGGSITALGKMAVDRRRQLRLTGALGYSIFYNSESNGQNRSKWSIFTLGAGTEYVLRRSGNSRPFVNFELDYNLMFGGWQTNVTYPDNYRSNVYVRFLPTSRLGISLGSGAEFIINRKTYLVAGIRGIWSNILPKQGSSEQSPYELYINDSRSTGGSIVTSTKQVITMQIYSGLSFNLF